MRTSVSLALALSFFTAACGQAPIPVGSTSGGGSSGGSSSGNGSTGRQISDFNDAKTLPDGHPTGMTHPGMEGTDSTGATFKGTVRLEGALAKREGFLFVNVYPEGLRMPCYSRKYRLSDEPALLADGDALTLDFVLDKNYELGGLVPGALTLEAVYDPDGYVDTKEPERVVGTVSAKAGDESIAVTLTK